MIGERLESRGDLPWVWLLLLAVGLGLVTAGLIFGTHALVTAAALPLRSGDRCVCSDESGHSRRRFARMGSR